MSQKLLHRTIGTIVFLIAAIQFFLTVQPSVSFWDPGELSAAAYMLQVPHPPGGPLFSLVGHFFYLLPIPGDPGLRMNSVSVLASAFSVLLLYLVAVRLIQNYRGRTATSTADAAKTYAAAAIGALALSFCDTFWFNGVEANYFAAATLLFSLMMWLVLIWHERADEPGSNKYLLLIAYLVGLSSGVHLMSVLTISAVVMIVVFRRYITDDNACKKTIYILLGHVALLLIISFVMWSGQTSQEIPSSEDLSAYDMHFVEILAAVSLLVIVLFRKLVLRRDSIYTPLAAGAVAVLVAYPGIIKKLPQLVLLLAGDNSTMGGLILLGIVACIAGVAHWSGKKRKPLLHLAALGILAVILGFSTYTMIMIRSGEHPPMNENEPKSFSSLLTYLNREQYGDFPEFKRRWSPELDRRQTWTNYSNDFDFFLRYQMSHMFTRYVLFNFAGSVSRDQDADWDWKQLYAIPLLVGLFGLFWHFRKDWRMGTVFLYLFVLMGYLIAFYQNQQQPQPRERDYFYSGAYVVFALWIALGIRGLLDLIAEKVKNPRTAAVGAAVVVLLGIIFIPGRMARVNYSTHDRSRDWLAWDMSYNMLQSCGKDAILFTAGDNDTFPLWFLQDVEGVRRDVRVVNLSLANAPWYIQQMKDKPYYTEALPVPISLSDSRIAGLQPTVWEPRQLDLPVSVEALAQFGVRDTAVINQKKISWLMRNTLQFGNTKAIRLQDILVLDVVFTNQWKRPIYFAATCGPDSKIGLENFLWCDGLTYRLEPQRVTGENLGVNATVLAKNLFNEPEGFSKTPAYGFKFRNLADPHVFFDENARRFILSYRAAFYRLAVYRTRVQHDAGGARLALDQMERLMPRTKFPLGMEFEIDLASAYYEAGSLDRYNELTSAIESECTTLIESGSGDPQSPNSPYRILYGIYDRRKDNVKKLELLKKLLVIYPKDQGLEQRIKELEGQTAVGSAARQEAQKVVQ